MRAFAGLCILAAALSASAAGASTRASVPLGVKPDVSEPAIVVNFVVAGQPDPNGKVPVLNGVPGSGVPNLAIADPQQYIPTGQTGIVFSVASNILTVPAKSTCTTAISVTAGKTKLYAGKTKPYSVGPLTNWLYVFEYARTTFSGSAVMVGKVACTGPAGAQSASLKAPLIFQ